MSRFVGGLMVSFLGITLSPHTVWLQSKAGHYWAVDPDAGALSFGAGALFVGAGAASECIVVADAGTAALDADALLPCSLLDFLEQEAKATAPNNTNGKIKIIFMGNLPKMMTARYSYAGSVTRRIDPNQKNSEPIFCRRSSLSVISMTTV